MPETRPVPPPSPPDRTPRPPSLSSYIRPVTLFLLLFTLTPWSFLHLLPFKHLHNPLTLMFIVLALYAPPTGPARLHNFLQLVLALSLQLAATCFHMEQHAKETLVSRMLTVATMGTFLHFLAYVVVCGSYLICLTGALFLFSFKYAQMIVAGGGTEDDLQSSPLMRFANSMQENRPDTWSTILMFWPLEIVNAATPAFLARGYASLVVGPAGILADSVSVKDIVAYGVAGSVGIFICKRLLVSLCEGNKVKTWARAIVFSANFILWAIVNVSSSVFVSVALAEKDILSTKSSVLPAVFIVFVFRFTLTLLETFAKAATKAKYEQVRVLLACALLAIVLCFARESSDRFLDALSLELENNAAM